MLDNNVEIKKTKEIISEFEKRVYAALETYSNVHRGSGHFSMVSTSLFEQSRDIILNFMKLNKRKYLVIFCTSWRVDQFIKNIALDNYKIFTSGEIGLELGVTVLAVKKKGLPRGVPLQTGGGTAKLISKDWVIWADPPDKFEAGTPAIINIIAFAIGVTLCQKYGKNCFINLRSEKSNVEKILYNDNFLKLNGLDLLEKLKNTLIGQHIRVPTMKGNSPYINLDNSASTPTFEPIWDTFRKSLFQTTVVRQEIIRDVKSICSKTLNFPETEYDIIFTSNTTEAINIVAENLKKKYFEDFELVVLNSILEHSSNELPWRMISGCSVVRLTIDGNGFIDIDELKSKLSSFNKYHHHGKKRIKIVAISGASNVLGICNDIGLISRIAHEYGAQVLVDGAQLVAHRKVDIEEWGIDYLAFSAHKVYAPFGCGVLIARKVFLNFSSDEIRLIKSSGEKNIGGIAALGKAFLYLERISMDVIYESEQKLTKYILSELSKIPGISIYGVNNPNASSINHKLGVIAFGLKSMMADKVSEELAVQSGIGVRHGCLCAHILVKHIVKIGPFLERFQWVIQTLFSKLNFPGVVRVSFGIENNEKDVEVLIHTINKLNKKFKAKYSKSTTRKMMDEFILESSKKVFKNF